MVIKAEGGGGRPDNDPKGPNEDLYELQRII